MTKTQTCIAVFDRRFSYSEQCWTANERGIQPIYRKGVGKNGNC